MEPLRDSWGREIKSLRVSVTDKCNFRCRYCMPAEGLEWLGREELLTFEEIQRLVRVLASVGVDEVRLTGGEPVADFVSSEPAAGNQLHNPDQAGQYSPGGGLG